MSRTSLKSGEKARLAILISGRGSNMRSLIDACKAPDFPAEIAVVLSNKGDAGGLLYAQQHGIPTRVISHTDFPKNRLGFDQAVTNALEPFSPHWVCLAGYMRLVTPWFCQKWHNRLINIHPSLLPSFKGVDAARQAYEAGVKIAGCTVHVVRPEMDSGPILAQAAVSIQACHTEAEIAAKILEQEHRIYPAVMKALCEGRLKIQADQVIGNLED